MDSGARPSPLQLLIFLTTVTGLARQTASLSLGTTLLSQQLVVFRVTLLIVNLLTLGSLRNGLNSLVVVVNVSPDTVGPLVGSTPRLIVCCEAPPIILQPIRQ